MLFRSEKPSTEKKLGFGPTLSLCPKYKLNSSNFKLFNATKCDGFDTGENICICFSMKISADFSKKMYRNIKANRNIKGYQTIGQKCSIDANILVNNNNMNNFRMIVQNHRIA